jgi:LPXTG-motif cell wall-anchored protein
MTRYLRGVAVASTVALSLLLAGPAQAQDVLSGFGTCGLVGIICQDQSSTQSQTSSQTSQQATSVNVQNQQAQSISGGVGGTAGTTTVRHVFVPTAAPRRVFFTRRAVGGRVFFVRNVVLARTGFNAWILALAGVGCMAGGAALMARRRRSSA